VERIVAYGARGSSNKAVRGAARVLRDRLMPLVFRYLITAKSVAWAVRAPCRLAASRGSGSRDLVRRKKVDAMRAKIPGTVAVRNVNHPGRVRRVDSKKYAAMRRAYLKTLPRRPPGLTPAELLERLTSHLPEKLFPHGVAAGWWAKTVQLDLEARHIVVREESRPLRLHKR
jgi:hypothetical protein